MIDKIRTARFGIALGLAATLLTPVDVLAGPSGPGRSVFPSAGFGPAFHTRALPPIVAPKLHVGRPALRHHRRHAFDRRLPAFVGAVLPEPYVNTADVPAFEPAELPPSEPPVLTCHRQREVVTVPSEFGGSRVVSVTRC